jgi:hypothetical protein
MQNQNQFVRQTAAILMACGLILGLLPGVATAQDLSTVEKRAAWLIEQYRGESIGPNAKFGPGVALARLALNPNDAYVIDRITHYMLMRPIRRLEARLDSAPEPCWLEGAQV